MYFSLPSFEQKSPDWVSALFVRKCTFIHQPVSPISKLWMGFATWEQITLLQFQFFTSESVFQISLLLQREWRKKKKINLTLNYFYLACCLEIFLIFCNFLTGLKQCYPEVYIQGQMPGVRSTIHINLV